MSTPGRSLPPDSFFKRSTFLSCILTGTVQRSQTSLRMVQEITGQVFSEP
uniref:Uncharacterized protein n=1 Tax=Anguilla anguilla TaxID=7936 RepID=A0A0E9VXT9_ANGAN